MTDPQQTEREAVEATAETTEEWTQRIFSYNPEQWPGHIEWLEEIKARVTRALQAARDEAERECIKAACGMCRSGNQPTDHGIEWWHLTETRDWLCNASEIYELRRRREEGSDDN